MKTIPGVKNKRPVGNGEDAGKGHLSGFLPGTGKNAVMSNNGFKSITMQGISTQSIHPSL
jgi:hypothetical protein